MPQKAGINMARILTGIQSSGKPHLGNILGAYLPAIEMSKNPKNDSFFFIADLHSVTTVPDGSERKENTLATAAAWIAAGFDTDANTFYRQSKVTEVCELAWYLSCFTPIPMLENAHSYKDKLDKIGKGKKSAINAGLFTYPVLMAADIIGYDADFVPVGKDQRQHLEITRDIANAFNHKYGETFVIPESKIDEQLMVIPGTDGNKMSKSYGNTIDIFQTDKALRKNIMAIVTDSTPLEEPKNPDSCNVFSLYKILASESQTKDLRQKYLGGNYGYGHAKQELFELILEKFGSIREQFDYLIKNPAEVDQKLVQGEAKARNVISMVLNRVRGKLGFL